MNFIYRSCRKQLFLILPDRDRHFLALLDAANCQRRIFVKCPKDFFRERLFKTPQNESSSYPEFQ